MKKFIFIFILFMFSITLISCGEPEIEFYINGSESISVEYGEEYEDLGAVATVNGVEEAVLVSNPVDTFEIDSYQVIYTLNYDGKVYNKIRTVNVIKPVLNDNEIFILKCALAIKENAAVPESITIRAILGYSDGSERYPLLEISGESVYGNKLTYPYLCEPLNGSRYDWFDGYVSNYEYNVGFVQTDYTNILGERIPYVSKTGDYNLTGINYYFERNQLPN